MRVSYEKCQVFNEFWCLHVPKTMEKEARRAAEDYARLKKVVQAISDANMKKFRRNIRAMKAKSLKSRA